MTREQLISFIDKWWVFIAVGLVVAGIGLIIYVKIKIKKEEQFEMCFRYRLKVEQERRRQRRESKMTTDLTIKWIIEELKKSGCNSKQIVIDKLESASGDELFEFSKNIERVAVKRSFKYRHVIVDEVKANVKKEEK